MKNAFFLVLLLFLGTFYSAWAVTLAILETESDNVDITTIKILNSNLIGEMANSRKIRLVERTRLDAVVQELGLISSGLTAESDSLAQIGKMTGADLLLLSSIGKVGSVYSINLRVINVETAQNEQSVTVSDNCSRSELHTLVKQACRELLYKMTGEELKSFSKGGVVTRSIFCPGWGQFYSGRYVRGSIYLAAFSASLTMLYHSWDGYQSSKKDYDDIVNKLNIEQNLLDKVRLATDLNSKRHDLKVSSDNFSVYAYSAAGIYLFNFVDALVTDTENPAYRFYSLEPLIRQGNNLQTGFKLTINL